VAKLILRIARENTALQDRTASLRSGREEDTVLIEPVDFN